MGALDSSLVRHSSLNVAASHTASRLSEPARRGTGTRLRVRTGVPPVIAAGHVMPRAPAVNTRALVRAGSSGPGARHMAHTSPLWPLTASLGATSRSAEPSGVLNGDHTNRPPAESPATSRSTLGTNTPPAAAAAAAAAAAPPPVGCGGRPPPLLLLPRPLPALVPLLLPPVAGAPCGWMPAAACCSAVLRNSAFEGSVSRLVMAALLLPTSRPMT
jgi:hypothetical protein